MPLYDFDCATCGAFEARESCLTRESLCPRCGTSAPKRFPQRVRFKVWFENFNSEDRDILREEASAVRREARARTFPGTSMKEK